MHGFIQSSIRLLALLAAATTSTATTTISTKSTTSASTKPISSSSHASTTTVVSGTPVYNMTVQTIFSPPPACTRAGISSMDISSGDLWHNAIVPAAGVIESSCYPSQFWSSAVATVSLPPFKQLVCPKGWGTNKINSTYIVCCPGGYGLYALNITNTQRPATRALCTSWIWPNVLYDITSWNSASIATTIAASAGTDGTFVFATPFDGIAASTTFTSAPTSSISSTSRSSIKTVSSTTSSSKSTSSKSSSQVPLPTISL